MITPDKLASLVAEAWPNSVNIMSGFKKYGYISPDKETLFQERFKENYDIFDDPSDVAWVKINHPEFVIPVSVICEAR